VSRRYAFFSSVGVFASVLDEHPVDTPQVGTPAFRRTNCSANQIPTTRTIVPMLSMMNLLVQRSAISKNP
jgi:hypothetical protein